MTYSDSFCPICKCRIRCHNYETYYDIHDHILKEHKTDYLIIAQARKNIEIVAKEVRERFGVNILYISGLIWKIERLEVKENGNTKEDSQTAKKND